MRTTLPPALIRAARFAVAIALVLGANAAVPAGDAAAQSPLREVPRRRLRAARRQRRRRPEEGRRGCRQARRHLPGAPRYRQDGQQAVRAAPDAFDGDHRSRRQGPLRPSRLPDGLRGQLRKADPGAAEMTSCRAAALIALLGACLLYTSDAAD